jgi:hypothetical protein
LNGDRTVVAPDAAIDALPARVPHLDRWR